VGLVSPEVWYKFSGWFLQEVGKDYRTFSENVVSPDIWANIGAPAHEDLDGFTSNLASAHQLVIGTYGINMKAVPVQGEKLAFCPARDRDMSPCPGNSQNLQAGIGATSPPNFMEIGQNIQRETDV
jgi:hypothetical protein